MKVKLKSVKEVLDMEQSKGNNYPTREEMLCYIPERFFLEKQLKQNIKI